MPKQNEEKIVSFTKDQMFDLVADIDNYSEFLPWCNKSSIIKQEINDVLDGKVDEKDNVLKNAPHTMQSVINSHWEKDYSREKAVFP